MILLCIRERYRDLIDAADTIGNMKISSLSVFDKLTVLREKLNTLPTQLTPVKIDKVKGPIRDMYVR